MDRSKFTEEFEKDVCEHRMCIIKDDDMYRHIRFKKDGTNNRYFDIITWPGYLCYTGDMGTYVFSRLRDMFEFFRGHKPNLRYWAEKAQAADKNSGIKRYNPTIFESVVREEIEEFCDGMSDDYKAAIMDDVEELISCADEGEEQARHAANEFMANGRCVFYDFWERDFTDFDYHFEWCCNAIPWAIAKYDEVGK